MTSRPQKDPQYGDTVLGTGLPLARCRAVVAAKTTTWGSEERMAYLALGALIVVVVGLTWLSSRRRQRSTGCCAPADPRDDMRMRAAFAEGTDGRQPNPPRP